MPDTIDLAEHGIRLFFCRLFNHDYLWFSSYEVSKVSSTYPVIHNYALSYSLADFSYGIYRGSTPRYEEDLAGFPLYATPAYREEYDKSRLTYNAVNSLTLRTDDAPRGINSPGIGWRVYLNPSWEKETHSRNSFKCYVFTFDGSVPRGVTRLGKKGAAMRIIWEEITKPQAVFWDKAIRPSHPVNPLDIAGKVDKYDPIMLPPHMLFRTAEIKEDWFCVKEGHRVHIPLRVIKRTTGGVNK